MTYLLSVLRSVSLILLMFSLTMLIPVLVNSLYAESSADPFLYTFLISFVIGGGGWLVVRGYHSKMHLKEAFLMVFLSWITISLFGALPFYLLATPDLSVVDAIFESVSGITTTGATALTNLESLPHAVLFYRHLLQWFGGLGIILIASAISPILGIGGMQLFRTELRPSRMVGRNLRTRDMARILWSIYLVLTVVCATGYWLAGMSGFDAICHSMSTVSIGGFSTHDASFAYFADKPAILLIATVFMVLAATNFALHFFAWQRRSLLTYWGNAEFRVFIVLALIMVSLTSIALANAGMSRELISGLFQAVSITTTTGFIVEPSAWPAVIFTLLLFASFVGGCTGSTAGGMKAIRFWMLLQQGAREMRQIIHPNSISVLKVGNRVLDDRMVQSVWGFFSAYIASLILIMLALMATGLDQETAFSASAAAINNLGPGLGAVAENYATVSEAGKAILSFAMLLGRLEIFALLVVISPLFWKK